MDIKTRQSIVKRMEEQGLIENDQLFKVTNKETGFGSYVPGKVMSMFIGGDYDYVHVGPNTKEALEAFEGKVEEKSPLELFNALTQTDAMAKLETVDDEEFLAELSDKGRLKSVREAAAAKLEGTQKTNETNP